MTKQEAGEAGKTNQDKGPIPSGDELTAADRLRKSAIGWIGSADAKATTIASVLSVVLGLVSIDMAEATRSADLETAYWAFLGLSALSVILCVATLWPVVNRKAYVPGSSLDVSPTFFGEIPGTFKEYDSRHVSLRQLQIDELEQAYIVARIAQRKMNLVRYTILSFIATMLTLILVAFLASVDPGPLHGQSTSTSACEPSQND